MAFINCVALCDVNRINVINLTKVHHVSSAHLLEMGKIQVLITINRSYIIVYSIIKINITHFTMYYKIYC